MECIKFRLHCVITNSTNFKSSVMLFLVLPLHQQISNVTHHSFPAPLQAFRWCKVCNGIWVLKWWNLPEPHVGIKFTQHFCSAGMHGLQRTYSFKSDRSSHKPSFLLSLLDTTTMPPTHMADSAQVFHVLEVFLNPSQQW